MLKYEFRIVHGAHIKLAYGYCRHGRLHCIDRAAYIEGKAYVWYFRYGVRRKGI